MKTTYSIRTVEGALHLKGHFFSTLIIPTPKEEVAKLYNCFPHDGTSVLAIGPKGKWSPSIEASIETIRKNVIKEIRNLEKKTDLRPSQVRRLELLKEWVATE